MKFVPNAVTRTTAKAVLKTRGASPRLLFAAGIVGVIATTVVACKATLKLEDVLTEAEKDKADSGLLLSRKQDNYTDAQHQATMRHITLRSGVKIVRLYAPALGLGVVSVACLTGSHNILSKRNAALTAAYATVADAFRDYRGRVAEEFGEEKEREILVGAKDTTVTVEGKNGPKQVKSKTQGDGKGAGYARFYDRHNKNWQVSPEFNLMFIRHQQAYANQKLQMNGHIFLNEVYDALGLERTTAGAVVGWLREDQGQGDGYVDFGLTDNPERMRDFAEYGDAGIFLDFNVDGTIFDKI